MNGHSDPHEIIESMRQWRRFPSLIAWLVALSTAWRAWDGSDILNPVLRGAAAWLAVLVVLRICFGWMERIVGHALGQAPSETHVDEVS